MMDPLEQPPTREQKLEMRRAVKRPSEWLRLLCQDWTVHNEALVDACDEKFLEYKPYMKGVLSSQLLCRVTVPIQKEGSLDGQTGLDFWGILGVHDEFDKRYIIGQIERFCSIYNIRGLPYENENMFGVDLAAHDTAAAQAAAGITVSPNGGFVGLPPYMDPQAAAAAAAAAVAQQPDPNKLSKKQATEVTRAQRMAKDAEKALEQERRHNLKKEQKRLSQERKEQKQREREATQARKAHERAQREATREDRRKKKLEIRVQREKFAQQQKDLALKRAAELVASNRVPIEITRGAAAAKAAANAALAAGGHQLAPEPTAPPQKKARSAIVVSTAADLHQIVTHSKNLWAKYNAIAKEHNQKVNWITVAKELGIHVKVREKYARMHSRAEQRGFDWEKNGHWKIKDHPEVFLEPTALEQRSKMPLPPPDTATTVLIGNTVYTPGTKEYNEAVNNPVNSNSSNNQQANNHQLNANANAPAVTLPVENHGAMPQQVAPPAQPPPPPPEANTHAAPPPMETHSPLPPEPHQETHNSVTEEAVAAAARVVDASGVTIGSPPVVMDTVVSPTEEQTAAAAAVAATFVADPTANLMHDETMHTGVKAQSI